MKKIISILLSVCLLVATGVCVSAQDTSFTDITDSEQLIAAQKLVEAGVIAGYDDGTFRPNAPVLRSELSRMINQLFSFSEKAENAFSDVNSNQWFYNEICIANKAGYLTGFEDGTFRPNSYVTREQACVILNKIMQFDAPQTAVSISDTVSAWAKDAVDKVVSANVIPLENGKFRATENITRGELCKALAKFVTDDSEISTTIADRADMVARLQDVSSILETSVMPKLSTKNETELVQLVIDNMKAYAADENYDMSASVKKAKALYATLSSSEKNEMQQLILMYVPTNDLLALKDFFIG